MWKLAFSLIKLPKVWIIKIQNFVLVTLKHQVTLDGDETFLCLALDSLEMSNISFVFDDKMDSDISFLRLLRWFLSGPNIGFLVEVNNACFVFDDIMDLSIFLHYSCTSTIMILDNQRPRKISWVASSGWIMIFWLFYLGRFLGWIMVFWLFDIGRLCCKFASKRFEDRKMIMSQVWDGFK